MNALPPHPPAVRTTCPYCGVGCGVLASPDGNGGATIAGDPMHPANDGRLCSKGSALGETLSLDRRLLHPMLRQADGSLGRVDWDTALDKVAGEFRTITERDGPEAIAFYLSGQLLTEDYYVANKLMKGFLGSSNVDTNSRLCMASSVAGHRRAFGADTVPGIYRDIDEADLIVLVGSNAAWCHPVLYQRMIAAKHERGAKLVVIDPRRTASAAEADLFLPIAPGMDTALYCGLLSHLADTLTLDYAYVGAHTAGFVEALVRSREIAPDVAATALATALEEADVGRFFDLFRSTERVVTCFSQGVNQSAQGTDKVNAIINVHLATGRIGRPGMGPFSLTGQPNAMGGREVGGLANQLAAHMGFTPEAIDRVGRFWGAPLMATREGLKAVDLFEAIERGSVKALWVMATNPAVSLPRAGAMRAALKKLDFFVVSENMRSNDTIEAGAHVLLPAAAWGEKDGTVTNSERRISRQRTFLPLPGEARPDWWIVSEVAQRLGFTAAFNYRNPAEVFREHAALSAFENNGRRDFDIGALASLPDEAYDALDPVMWPLRAGQPQQDRRFFSAGDFFTDDGRARFVAPERPDPQQASGDYPLRLNSGRVRDQWHTMTRTGSSPRLGAHLPEPFVEIHPADAKVYKLADGGFAKVITRHGSATLRSLRCGRPAARLDLCANSLERRQCERCPHRRLGHGGDRSVFGAARSQSHLCTGGAGGVRLPGLRADPSSDRIAGGYLVCARGGRRWRGDSLRDQRSGRAVARPRDAADAARRGTRGICRSRTRHRPHCGLPCRSPRWLHLRRAGTGAAAMGRAARAVRGPNRRRKRSARSAIRTLCRWSRRNRPDDLLLLRRRAGSHPRCDCSRQGGKRRRYRPASSRRHQLRFLPAGAARDRRADGEDCRIARCLKAAQPNNGEETIG